VGLFERGQFIVVTGNTKGDLFILKEIGFIRTVGNMAGQAGIGLDDLVLDFLFVVCLLVALITDFLPLRL